MLPRALLAASSFCFYITNATAAGITYAPLMDAQTTVTGASVQNITNYFGGNVTATLTTSATGLWAGALPSGRFEFIGSYGVEVIGLPRSMTFTFSQSVTRALIGWSSTKDVAGFNYSVYDGATEIANGYVAATSVDAFDSSALFDFSNVNGFTSVILSQNVSQSFEVGYDAGAAVPEPSAYGIGLGGLALVGAVIRRRAKKA